jgi:hypothetical protein
MTAPVTPRTATTTPLVVRSGWPRVLWIAGAVLLVTMVFHIVALVVKGGPVSGPVSLRKPATFAETGWLIAWSVALILPRLHTRPVQRHIIGATTVLFGIGETTIMAIQAWRGVPSHYNFSTPFDAALVRGGAAGTAGLFLIGVIVLLVTSLRTPDLRASLRLGLLAGVVLLLVGCLVGFAMISNNSGVFEGTIGSGFANRSAAYLGPDRSTVGPEYLLLRPATRGGDLVLPHAIGVHGLVLLAVPAVLLTGTGLSAARQLRLVAVAVGGTGLAVTLLLVNAFRSRPLDRLDPASLVTIVLCGVALIAVYIRVVASWLSPSASHPVGDAA